MSSGFLFPPRLRPVCHLVRVDSSLPKSYDIRVDGEVLCEPFMYVVYHAQDCVISACSRGKLLPITSDHPSEIRTLLIKFPTLLITQTDFLNIKNNWSNKISLLSTATITFSTEGRVIWGMSPTLK